MKFTKLTLFAALLVLLVCAFVACGGDLVETEAGDLNTEVGAVETDPVETEAEIVDDGTCKHVIVEEIDEPTCESRGYRTEVCSVCNEQLSVKPIDVVDHIEAAPATCTEGSVCKFCGAAMVGPTGHLIGEVTASKEATATEAGFKTGKCITCDIEITEEIPAGITEDFSSYREGQLTADAMAESGNFSGYTIQFGGSAKPESYMIVSENGNQILSKAADQSATITFVDTEGKLNEGKFAISFDYRMDGEASSTGLLSFKDSNGTEHRILSAWAGNMIRVNKNKAPVLIEGINPADGIWYNIRVVVDPSTYDYEFYVNGTKVIYTVFDESVSGKHVIWTLQDGIWESVAAGTTFNDTNCFGDASRGVSSIYMFHYGRVACSIDNLKIEYFSK